jgi:hypothetical protein
MVRPMTPTPSRIRLRTYQVGFGDCLLLTITYTDAPAGDPTQRHLLVDFGAKVLAKGVPRMADLASVIAEHCGGHLDAVVATHRHQDHLRGFGDSKAKELLHPLQPALIIRPWTDAPADRRQGAADDLDPDSTAFLGLLDTLAEHGNAVREQFALDRRVLAGRARELSELGVSNVDALAMLDAWVPADRTRFVRAGETIADDPALPGVTIEVLGPPTLKQVPGMGSFASDSSAYWLGMTREAVLAPEIRATTVDEELRAKQTVAQPWGLGRAAWLIDHLHDSGLRQVLEIVEGFDDVLSNTSLILLVTVGERTLLFAGDAQVAGWSYTLDRALGQNGKRADRGLRARLSRVDVYKVGHHGGRKATPKRLVGLWKGRKDLHSVLSTREGTYGTTTEGKVPDRGLVDALAALGQLHTTQQLPPEVWWFDVEGSATSQVAEFTFAEGPTQGTRRTPRREP